MVRQMNEQVTEDDLMKMNGQSADDLNDESHKMTSQTHQMMSQQQQVVETTPGQSQKLLRTSETVNLTEKIQASQQGHKMQHNDGKRLFSGFLVSFASVVVERNCWMKQ